MGIKGEGLTLIKLLDPLITWSHVIRDNKAIYLYFQRPIASKLEKGIAYGKWLLHKNSHGSLITRSSEVAWQMKSNISSHPRRQWLPNLTWWWLKEWPLWSRGNARYCGKWKMLSFSTKGGYARLRYILKRYISIYIRTMTTKLYKVVTQDKDPPTTKSFYLLVTWSTEVMWQRKSVVSAFSRNRLSNLRGRWVLTKGFYP